VEVKVIEPPAIEPSGQVVVQLAATVRTGVAPAVDVQ